MQESLATIQKAKAGDRAAWDSVCREYCPRWIRACHGELGDTLRRLWDTEDIVQSAVAEAIKDVESLRNEAAFYAWVSAIIRRKIAQKRRISNRLRPVALQDLSQLAQKEQHAERGSGEHEDTARVLDALLALFPSYPEHMAGLYLKYFARHKIPEVSKLMGLSLRSTERLLSAGLLIVKSQLDS